MAKNYYVILGVEPDATQDQIKSAYRKEAKRLHPDHTGGGCEPFRDVQEAYEVLGDPLRRRTYDDEVAREKRRTARGIEPEPLAWRGSPVEPLVSRWRSTDPWDRFFATPFHSLLDEVFNRAWRDLDIPVSPRQVTTLAESLTYIDLANQADFQAAAQASLVTRQEHIALFRRAFREFWQRDLDPAARGPRSFPQPASGRSSRLQALLAWEQASNASGWQHEDEDASRDRSDTYSDREVLRLTDFGRLTAAEAAQLRRLMQAIRWRPPVRRTRRMLSGSRGQSLDMRSTWRHNLRHGGEMLALRRRRRQRKPRPLVLLCDISGSMERYARILLQLSYVLSNQTDRRAPTRVETFVFGTRLTRLTRRLRTGNIEQALREAAAGVQDWGGGTRTGEALKQFNYHWGRRVLRNGAVVLVISDGIDRGDIDLLAREMARLQRSCHRVIWLNPLLGNEGYQPLVRGMQAALPFVDDFLPIHNLASLEQVLQALNAMAGPIRMDSEVRRNPPYHFWKQYAERHLA